MCACSGSRRVPCAPGRGSRKRRRRRGGHGEGRRAGEREGGGEGSGGGGGDGGDDGGGGGGSDGGGGSLRQHTRREAVSMCSMGPGRACAAHVREGECAPNSTRGVCRRRAEARAPWGWNPTDLRRCRRPGPMSGAETVERVLGLQVGWPRGLECAWFSHCSFSTRDPRGGGCGYGSAKGFPRGLHQDIGRSSVRIRPHPQLKCVSSGRSSCGELCALRDVLVE